LTRGTNGDRSYEAKGHWLQGKIRACDEIFPYALR
jgi:hypothetical protein